MSRFLFHLHNSIEAIDEEGRELPNMGVALAEAIRQARHLIASEIIDCGQLHLAHWLEIEDENGVKTPVRFSDCVEVNP